MGRRSVREERRAELVAAFSRVLADHGFAGATMAAVADEAGVAPGLIHHHFEGKQDLLNASLDSLLAGFSRRVSHYQARGDQLGAYIDGALRLDGSADTVAARCWVGILAEAVRHQGLFNKVRRLIDSEINAIQRRSGGALGAQEAGAVLAFIIGALVVGAFAPRKTAGFAAPSLKRLVSALGNDTAERSQREMER